MASKQNWDALNAALRNSAASFNVSQPGRGGTTTVANDTPYKPYDPNVNGIIPSDSIDTDPGPLDRLFDVLSRPAYALNNVIKDTIDKDPNTDNPLESLWAGLSGIDKTRGVDIVREVRKANDQEYTPEGSDAVGGLLWDLIADPLNFIPMGWAGKLASKGYQGLTKGKAAVKDVEGIVAPELTGSADAIARETARQAPPPGAGGAPGTPTPGPGPTGGGGGGAGPMPGAAPPPGRVPPMPAGAAGTPAAQAATSAGQARRAQQAAQAAGPGAAATSPIPPIPNVGPVSAAPVAPATSAIGDQLLNLFQTKPAQYDIFDRTHFDLPTSGAPEQAAAEPFRFQSGTPDTRFSVGSGGVAQDLAAKGGPGVGRGLVSKPALDIISRIPTGWSEGTKNTIKEMVQSGKKLPPYIQDLLIPKPKSAAQAARETKAAAAASKLNETDLINDAVSTHVTENPSVITHVDEPKQSVVMPESSGVPAADAAVKAAGKVPSDVAAGAVEQAASATGRSVGDVAAEVTGRPVTEVPVVSRPANVSPNVTMREQYETVQNLTRSEFNKARAANPGNFAAAKTAQQAAVMSALDADKAAMVAAGRYPAVTTIAGSTYHLHSSDVYKAVGPAVTKAMQFSNWDIPISSQIHGAARAVELNHAGVDANVAIGEIADTIKKAHHTSKTFDKRATIYAKNLWDARDPLTKAAADNEALFKTQDAVVGRKIGDDIGANVESIMDSKEHGVGDALNAVANIPKAASKAAAASGGSAGAASVGSAVAGERLAPRVISSDAETARHVQNQARLQSDNVAMNSRGNQHNPYNTQPGQQAKARTANNSSRVNRNQQRWATQQLNNIHRAASLAGVARIDTVAVSTDSMFRRILDGFVGHLSGGYGMGTLFPVGRRAFDHYGDASVAFNNIAQRARAAHDPYDVLTAMEAVRNKTARASLSPEIQAAYDDLVALGANNIGLSDGINAWGDAAIWRNGGQIDSINHLGRKYDIGMEYRPKDNHLEVPEQWREKTDIQDPIGWLVNHHAMNMEFAGNETVGRYLGKEFGSKTGGPGLKKIARSPEYDLSHHISDDLYFPDHVIDMVRRYNLEIAKNTKFNGKLMNDFIDPFTSAWKTSATIVRVGHILRNFMGDTMFTGMDGSRYMNPKYNVQALETQRATGKLSGVGGFTGKSTKVSVQDDLTRLNELLAEKPPKPTGKVVTVTLKNGQKEDIAYNQLEWYAHQAGLTRDYRKLEDILETGPGGLNKIFDPIKNSKFVNAMGKASEITSNNTRLSHLLGLMDDGKVTKQYDSVASMINGLSARVQKFHPDAGGLTKFEQKYMRRIIPFYTWFKQAAPTMFMTTLTHPARPMAVSKINYNMQLMLGMDPKSQGDPFQEGSYFPNFLRSSLLGPLSNDNNQGTMVDWGSPTEAMASILQGKPGANLAEMLNPLIKTPIGLAQGHHPLDAEHFIPDASEWIDRAIPYANQISNLTGYSASGSLETLASGEGLDPQRAVVKGEKDTFFNNQNFFNYWSPFTTQNTDRESYFNIARGENQNYQETNDPLLLLKKRLESGQVGLPNVATGGLSR